jgi:hypothetical protein
MKLKTFLKIAALLLLAAQALIGVAQVESNEPQGLCNWHIDHCDYNGCTGVCGAQSAQAQAEEPGKDEVEQQPPADQCWCLF